MLTRPGRRRDAPRTRRRAAFRAGLAAGASLLALLSCGPHRAIDEMRGSVLFYAWTYGATLSDDPTRVAEITRDQIRRLREIEDFAGTLEAWQDRTGPVDRLRVGPEDIVLDGNIYFYYLASMQRPALTDRIQVRITRTAPDGAESVDLLTTSDARMNQTAQAGGILFAMTGLAAGDHRLQFEVLDRDRTAATGDLWLEYRPGTTEPTGSRAGSGPPVPG